ncbi:MAG: hypothetical protein PHR77_08545 [Kiritimatiellae bacterium]|nr:hypothetical protein [Kiritimatiellia bacterium]MDD5519960.1 hypothetical protein [Kiritimatiellia bacterium]
MRQKAPQQIELQILLRSRRRCAMCFGLEGSTAEVKGQIAHLDRNPDNNDPDNLEYLCLRHHDAYDSKHTQAKNYTPEEVKHFRSLLQKYLETELIGPSTESMKAKKHGTRRPTRQSGKVAPAIYDRRVPIYLATRDLLISMIQKGRAPLDEVGKFAKATDEALFICGPDIASYLDDFYRKAVALEFATIRLDSENLSDDERAKVIKDKYELFLWIGHEMPRMKERFAAVMTLNDG